MIGLDTNVLVRYITGDDAEWSKAATDFIDGECTAERTGYVNPVVLAEVVWVLRGRSDFTRERVADLIAEFLESDSFTIGNEAAVLKALDQYRKNKAGFADCLIAELNAEAGAFPTYAIDKDAVKDGIFKQLPRSGTP